MDLEELCDLGDLDELLREVDRLCARQAWSDLERLRRLARAALDRGRQLWPVASHAEYRLALEADGSHAARVVREGAGQFALGPLSEVAASTHEWAELATHLDDGPQRATVLQERIIRGEDLQQEPIDHDLPSRLQEWEPDYPVAVYRSHDADFPAPAAARLEPLPATTAGALLSDTEGHHALRSITQHWVTQSNGRCDLVAVEGDAASAVAALGAGRVRMARTSGADALAWLAWAAASGGAHGRRRGMAAGRFDAWWAVVGLVGLLDHWPLPAAEVGELTRSLEWSHWDAHEPTTGWNLRLAVHDPETGVSWAYAATDG